MMLHTVLGSEIEALELITRLHISKWLGIPQVSPAKDFTKRATSCNPHCPHWWSNSRQLKRDLYSHKESPQMSRSTKQALLPTPPGTNWQRRLSVEQGTRLSTETLEEPNIKNSNTKSRSPDNNIVVTL
ncbi:hypothetical protein DPMN_029891 [Dreissena polymorpha]|uniref:Uncharacterized protein n=1 Tax=Dreissena polymorpha TaxID=45954 RepID=A0A9D4LZW8_DREPO|nr:hypothetical protein DPMN_029891 [Dreissena polymorpha]